MSVTTQGTLGVEGQQIETDINLVAGVGAAAGGPIGVAVDAAVHAAEGVANTIVEDQQTHSSAVTTAGDALATLAQTAPTVLSASGASAETVATATTKLSLIQTIFKEFLALF